MAVISEIHMILNNKYMCILVPCKHMKRENVREKYVACLAGISRVGIPLVSSAILHLSFYTSTHTSKQRENMTLGCNCLFKKSVASERFVLWEEG